MVERWLPKTAEFFFPLPSLIENAEWQLSSAYNSKGGVNLYIELQEHKLDQKTATRISSFDRSVTTGFKSSSLRASLLTVLRVVYALVRLSSGKTMVSILHVDLISCRYF